MRGMFSRKGAVGGLGSGIVHQIWFLLASLPVRGQTNRTLLDDCRVLALWSTEFTNAQAVLDWNTTDPEWCCPETEAIHCDFSLEGRMRVTRLNLGQQGLSGNFSEEFALLSALIWLDASSNNFTSIVALPTSLEHIDFSSNKLQQGLDFVGSLANVTYLDFSNNKLQGGIGALKDLKKLEILSLMNNELDGSLASLSGATGLTSLHLGNNKFERDINFLKRSTNLTLLDLRSNRLSGSLEVVQGFTQLVEIRLGRNLFVDTLSPFMELTKLENLGLNSNQIMGDLSPLMRLTHLKRVSLGGNSINGTLESLGNLTRLEFLYLDLNGISGGLNYISGLLNLRTLWVASNHLDGPITAVAGMTKLEQLDLSSNNFTGNISPVETLTNLAILNLEMNDFEGGIEAVRDLVHLTDLFLSWNRFESSLAPLRKLTKMTLLLMVENRFTGNVSDLQGMVGMKDLWLSGNQLSASLSTFSRMPALHHLAISRNLFFGSLQFLENLTNLYEFAAAYNQLSGSLAPLKGLQHGITSLDLSNNLLTGSLSALEGLHNLEVVNLNSNQLAGPLDALRGLNKTIKIDFGNNKLTGTLPDVWLQAKFVNVSCNKLESMVEEEQEISCVNCVVLDVSTNIFTKSFQSVDTFRNTSFINLKDNDIVCPYLEEPLDARVVTLGKCLPDVERYIAVGFLAFGVFISVVAAGVTMNCYCSGQALRRSNKLRYVRYFIVLGLGVLDISSDFDFLHTMQTDIAQGPDCCLFTKRSFFGNILPKQMDYPQGSEIPYPRDEDYQGDDTFAQYMRLADHRFSRRLTQVNEDFIADLCNRMQDSEGGQLCAYNPSTASCEPPSFASSCGERGEGRSTPYAYFGVYVDWMLRVYVAKEACKLVAILLLSWRRLRCRSLRKDQSRGQAKEKDFHLGAFCSMSVFSPLLVLTIGPRWEFFYEGFLENFPMLVLSGWFMVNVTESRASNWNILSVTISSGESAWLVIKALGRLLRGQWLRLRMRMVFGSEKKRNRSLTQFNQRLVHTDLYGPEGEYSLPTGVSSNWHGGAGSGRSESLRNNSWEYSEEVGSVRMKTMQALSYAERGSKGLLQADPVQEVAEQGGTSDYLSL